MDTAHEVALRVGVARTAIRLVWTATLRAPYAVFADSAIVWSQDEPAEVLNECNAAERLVLLPRPLVLSGEESLGNDMRLMINAPALDLPADGQRPRALEFLNQTGDKPVLILAAGWGYRLSPEAVHHLIRDYRFAAPLGGGGPPEDLWTLQLNLPPSWLDGCGFVGLAGRWDRNSMQSPMRTGDGWNEQSLVVV